MISLFHRSQENELNMFDGRKKIGMLYLFIFRSCVWIVVFLYWLSSYSKKYTTGVALKEHFLKYNDDENT